MDTAPLKSFATWARTTLIREVTARISMVLAPASPERVERPKVVAALEKAITAAGGGDEGRATVADKAAYTWFNRIIALRFMDANGYTGVGVVSPEAGLASGQPEILAEAKRGVIDSDAVGPRTIETVTGLLDGTRRSDDPQGEAYALLLAAYCRRWNRSMPFMFERDGDFTELLMPGNLLAADSVLSRVVEDLTEEVCQDVEVIGWLYQFYISERKDEVFADFKKNRKAGVNEIPAATQLFTPHWIVRYLVENSLGRLWMLNRPSSRLVDQMDYYIPPVEAETDFLKVSSPERIKIIDPACGSGHMLTYAFDLLHAIYKEEGYAPAEIPELILTKNLYGSEIDPRAGALAAFALMMKARSEQRTFFNKEVDTNICVLGAIQFDSSELEILLTDGGDSYGETKFWNQFRSADTFGALIEPNGDQVDRSAELIEEFSSQGGDLFLADVLDRARRVVEQAKFLSAGYHIVVANPPYMGSKNMCALLSEMAQLDYPESKYDLFSMFMERSFRFAIPGGVAAMVTRDAWMFLTRFADFRGRIVKEIEINSIAHLGNGVFEGINGAVVQAVAFCLNVRRPRSAGTYLRLVDEASVAAKDRALRASRRPQVDHISYVVDQAIFTELPGSPLAYWASPELRRTFDSGKAIEDVAPVRQGFQTGDNDRFMRFWYEVSAGAVKRDASSVEEFHSSAARFAPYLKGGSFRKWYGNDEYVVMFDKESYQILGTMGNKLPSRALYFKDSITWSALSDGDFGARYSGVGSTFSAKGACAFPVDEFSRAVVLAVFNSSVARELLEFMGATLDFNVGSLRHIPIPLNWPAGSVGTVCSAVSELVEIHRKDWSADESAPGFSTLDILKVADDSRLAERVHDHAHRWSALSVRVCELQTELDSVVAEAYGLSGNDDMPVTLRNTATIDAAGIVDPDFAKRNVVDLISFAIGCMFGRYSLDDTGLILADQGVTLQDYLAKVPTPVFMPDCDNVIPIVDGDWFEDDIVARFREFLRAAFGEQHFEENLRFVTEALGVKILRDYFAKRGSKTTTSRFYDDHVQRYKKRPIYWLFSSPRGSFNALIYMHRYAPSTVSTVLNEYLREYSAKLASSLQNQERLAAEGGTPRQQAAAQKESDRLRKVLLELEEYERELYVLASQQIEIDLDDGVKVNYPKFGTALKKIPGLEAASE